MVEHPGFEPHRRYRVMSLSKTHLLPTVLVKPRKHWLLPGMTEKLLSDWDVKHQNKQINQDKFLDPLLYWQELQTLINKPVTQCCQVEGQTQPVCDWGFPLGCGKVLEILFSYFFQNHKLLIFSLLQDNG